MTLSPVQFGGRKDVPTVQEVLDKRYGDRLGVEVLTTIANHDVLVDHDAKVYINGKPVDRRGSRRSTSYFRNASVGMLQTGLITTDRDSTPYRMKITQKGLDVLA